MKYWYKHECPALHNMTLLFWGERQFSIGNGGQHAWFMKYWDIQLYFGYVNFLMKKNSV